MATSNPRFPRCSGLLLHPTSLPGPDGIGDLGRAAARFVDWLAEHRQSLWQVLPLGPTGFGDSPYQSLSALAGNPLLIDLEDLTDRGWLDAGLLAGRPGFPADRVDFGAVIPWKQQMLAEAWRGFTAAGDGPVRWKFVAWCEEQAWWLDDFALFMALKQDRGGQPWTAWPKALARRESAALAEAAGRLAGAMDLVRFAQWVFAEQWSRLKSRAAEAGIRLLGDVPIFVAHDSCDVWARQDLFLLDADGSPSSVAGVPPDYFSPTGQLWGNPLYDWEAIAAEDFRWWTARLRRTLELVDLVRLDHFRGFEAYWEVPADAPTAETGRWVPGPGADLFDALGRELGEDLPLVAEDLGVITPAVDELRERYRLPGMRVLQFAWSGPDNLFLPHEHEPNTVVYCGTHDNDPTNGWWEHLADERTRELVAEYAGCPVAEPNWTLIRLGMMSCAATFVASLQDVLGLGREGRMNLPGRGDGNWDWRMTEDGFDHAGAERLARLTWLYRRDPAQKAPGREDPAAPDPGSLS